MNIHLEDLAKLDELIEHASYHQKEYGDNWFTFFQKHLGSDKEEHLHLEHPDEHEKLPQHDHMCSSVLAIVILQEEKDFLKFTIPSPMEKEAINYIENYSFLAHTNIFQPPKHA